MGVQISIGSVLLLLLDKYPEVDLLDPVVILCLIFEGLQYHLPQQLYRFTFPPATRLFFYLKNK